MGNIGFERFCILTPINLSKSQDVHELHQFRALLKSRNSVEASAASLVISRCEYSFGFICSGLEILICEFSVTSVNEPFIP